MCFFRELQNAGRDGGNPRGIRNDWGLKNETLDLTMSFGAPNSSSISVLKTSAGHKQRTVVVRENTGQKQRGGFKCVALPLAQSRKSFKYKKTGIILSHRY